MPTLVEPCSPWVMPLRWSARTAAPVGWLGSLIDEPPAAVAQALQARGFRFLTPREAQDRANVLATAEEWIDHIPSLSCIIRELVEKVFLLKAPEEYDISHSEPCWPAWILVSAPEAAGAVFGLRVAENVVHEAMHLQLTNLEERIPLVSDITSSLYSPWKQEPRQLQGVLHGLYVFACIAAFYRHLLEADVLQHDARDYAARRILNIREEAGAIPLRPLATGLTDAGRQLLDSIREPIITAE
ncbi:MAG TPA: HEXXH motif-containing putative peptide modification protein [Nitrospira sp.]|nr:HEXXH motif-containing putative peptide modification protein [Nitrospira sp.]